MMMILVRAAAFAALASAAMAAEWPPAADYVNTTQECGTVTNCSYTKQVWSEEYAKATAGDYGAQRNVSFCLSTGCDGAIRINKILGCAWRFVILESGHLSADTTDTTNLKFFCGPENVDKAGQATAENQAKRMLKMLGQ